jgi:hypothetical protein
MIAATSSNIGKRVRRKGSFIPALHILKAIVSESQGWLLFHMPMGATLLV